MMEAVSLNLTLLTLCLMKKNIFCSACHGKIIFGEIQNFNYCEKKYFIIYRADYPLFFHSIKLIFTALCHEAPTPSTSKKKTPDISSKGIVMTLPNHYLYSWEAFNDNVCFNIENENEIIYKITFTLSEFDNFVQSFKNLLFPSTLFRDIENTVFNKISKLPLQKILEIHKDLSKLQAHFNDENESLNFTFLSILFKTNIDVLLVHHKFAELEDTKNFDSVLKLILD